MAQNYAGSGRVVTLTAIATTTSGQALRLNGLNGVALINAATGEPFTFQVEGIFTLTLASVTAGAAIYIDVLTGALGLVGGEGKIFFGRALTASDSADKFACRIQQTTDA